ncbi:AfsR/SARP family transcriptional regulator [Streptomyces althioticus]|uniref:AfsR/SARP family transcriptional regulator n=2 Tax=Streptomyces althioticus TaxID=83380 RepID=A0ABZ1XYW4_9ACTN|nr:AfsR/SARP family transcriptional regulator [Streptomyces sp. DSM 41972]WTB51071.1 AfsR/SARP family transcriptional regulator [Streptomyces althioticus]WTB96975.1 AfsR/SARP family transcriptional regulator [Streptomyces althioticus]SCD92550.1 DNA-binding transcriptional activator of the SARP family [Streptomyces sp. di50b]SCE38513.1 DNA-binding transcriptional activator of the SARP family [Streptomyces sp. di188]
MRFTILGPVGIVTNNELTPVAGHRQRILLASLLLADGRLLTNEQLYSELWGEDPPHTAHNALQAQVSRLRRTLGRLSESSDETPPVVTHSAGYVLKVDPSAVDMHTFRCRTAEARRVAATEPGRAVDLLDSALALWRGKPLQDVGNSPLCHSTAVQLEEEYLTAQETRLELKLHCGRTEEAIGELRAISVVHPWRERITEMLMLSLYHVGRRAEALETYHSTRRQLTDHLGIEPSRRLKDTLRVILHEEPAPAPRTRPALVR